MKIRKAASKKARIEIIPMIDAIFFLLVFFMFSSLSMVRLSGSNVAVPAKAGASSAAPQAGTDTNVVVSVASDGQLYVGRQSVTQPGLSGELEGRLSRNPQAIVVVNIDKAQKAQKLISVIDSINAVTLPDGKRPTILIATDPVTPQPQ